MGYIQNYSMVSVPGRKASLLTLTFAFLFSGLLASARTVVPLPNDIQGEWKQPCQITADKDVVQYSVQIHAENWIWISTGFEKEGCQAPYLSLVETKKAIFTDKGFLDLTLVKAEYLPQTNDIAKTLNSIQFCGLSNWANGVAQEVSGLACSDFKIPKRGDNTYTIFQEDLSPPNSAALSFGVEEGGFDGSSPEKRHRKLSPNFYSKATPSYKRKL